MAFEKKELNTDNINGGQPYKNGDALQASAINEIVGGVLNLQEKDSGGKIYKHEIRFTCSEIFADVNFYITIYSSSETQLTQFTFIPPLFSPFFFEGHHGEVGFGWYTFYDGKYYVGQGFDTTTQTNVPFETYLENAGYFVDNVTEV